MKQAAIPPEKKSVAIITARGGSKRIPHKNIRDFCGKPIISYSIEAALSSGVFDEVMVSTDDETIASIARSFGAAVPFMRSAESANDYASTDDVIAEVLRAYEAGGPRFDRFCCIYPTAPFVTAENLYTFTDYIGNPDVNSYSPNNPMVRGADYTTYPQSRKYIFGVNLTF